MGSQSIPCRAVLLAISMIVVDAGVCVPVQLFSSSVRES